MVRKSEVRRRLLDSIRIIRGTHLWLVAAACFAGGIASRLYIESTGDPANAYGVAVGWQRDFYGMGLAFFLAWLVLQAREGQRIPGCVVWLTLLFASGIAILSSIPK